MSENLVAQKTFRAYQESLKISNTQQKNDFLKYLASFIDANRQFILDQNSIDIKNAEKNNISKSVIDRILLNDSRIDNIISSIDTIINLPDPIGNIENLSTRPQGFKVGKMRTPIGVIFMIYEARPNVTIDATTLIVKSGNAGILRGGSDAYYSNLSFMQQIYRRQHSSSRRLRTSNGVPLSKKSGVC